MSQFPINYMDNLIKEKLNKNYPKTPCIKSNYNKEERIPFNNSKSRSGSMNKSIKGNSNSKKKYKINSNLILEQDNHKKNNYIIKNFCSKNILNINNACFNDLSNKNSYYNNISGNNFYNKKINYILNYENLTKSNYTKSNTDSNNFNLTNKTNSLIHNNSGVNYNNSNNFNITITKNNKEISSKKNINNINKRPSVPKSKNKNNEDIKNKNKGKPMSLLENKKNNINNSNYNNKSMGQTNNNINKTQFNNYNIYNFLNSNNFLKRNFLSNITYTNDTLYNNLMRSNKNDSTPISKKYKVPTNNKKNMKKKGIKKSQSQSHFNYKIAQDLNSQNKNSSSKNGKKTKRKTKPRTKNNLYISINKKSEGKNLIKNKDLNINNINKLNYNIIKTSSQKKNYIMNVKYPSEESKSMLYNNEYYNYYNYNKINQNKYIINNFPVEYYNDPLFKKISNLWEEIGGISPDYKEKFINFTMKYENKKEIFKSEINELCLIKNNLKKLNDDIKSRNEIINKIKNINNNINNNNYEEIKNLLISLRTLTINFINDYILFLKEISYDILMNKYDINKIKNFNKNYLNEIKVDTNFLKDNIHLSKIFSFFKNDPFLIKPSISNSNNNKYLILPLDNDIFQKINKCQYILLKEKIFENISHINNNKNVLKSFIYNNLNNYINNNDNDKINNYINSYRHINKDVNKISQNNISNNKSYVINSANNYKSFKCNDFCYINNKTKKEDNNKNENNIIVKKIYNKIDDNNNSVENISNIVKKVDSEITQIQFINYSNDFNENEKKMENKNEDNLEIIPYNKDKDPSLSILYSKYLSSINDNLIKSFNINKDIFYYSKIGLYPKILLFKDKKLDIKGICTLSFNENLNMTRKILWITSISCIKEYKISKMLLDIINYCKKNEIIFDSIEINLYYIKNEYGKFILDEELEKEIKSEVKFKWVRLENDGEKRKIKYHYIPNNIITNKENSILNNANNICDTNLDKYAINSNNYVLIKYYKENENNISMIEHNNIFFIINLLKKYYLLDNNDKQEIENILNNLKGIKLKKIIRILSEYNTLLETNTKDFKKDYCSNDNFNIELLYTFLEIIEKNKNNKEKNENFLCLNFNNIYTNFSNIIKIEIDGYEYNVISMNNYIIEVFNIDEDIEDEYNENINIYENNNDNINHENKEKEFLYFSKSESENISFIFYEVKENNIENKNDIKLLFNKVLRKIIIKDSKEPFKSFKKICLPSFSYKKRNDENENKNDKEDDKLNLIEYDILYYDESIDFCIENLINNDIKFSFPLDKNINENDEIVIIKNNFVIAIINNDLILDFQIPSMNIYYICKDNWIKVKK